ncbi:MAG: phosphopantetheine-binding protein [Gammaproteobacteria bacterium]
MSNLSFLEREVADLIIESLNLEDITLDDIEPNEPLFNEGLGLDSIDALELAVSLSARYGIQLRSDDSGNKAIFSSLRALASYVESHRKDVA